MGLLTELQEGLLPLPFIGPASRHPKLHHLSRKVRKRIEARAVLDHELNHVIKEINGLGKGLVGCGRAPPPADTAFVSSCPTAPDKHKLPLNGLREHLARFRSLEESTPWTDASAFSALAKKVVPDYGGASGNPALASFGDAPMSHPPKGSIAVPIENMLPELEAAVVRIHLRLLLREGELPQTPQPYWDPGLIKDSKSYAELIDTLLWAGVLSLGHTRLEEVGIFFIIKGDGSSPRILIDAKRANAHFKEPPCTQLCSGAAICETWVDSDLPLYQTGADVRDYFYRLGLPEMLRPYFSLKDVELSFLTHPSAAALLVEGHTVAVPQLAVCPMGWSWALHLAQLIHLGIFEETEELTNVHLLAQRNPAVRLSDENQVVGFAYVDDSGLLGLRPSRLSALHNKYGIALNDRGLRTHETKSYGAILEDIKLGYHFDGTCCIVEPRQEKVAPLRRSLRRAVRVRRVPGKVPESLVGPCSAHFILRRLYYSMFQDFIG